MSSTNSFNLRVANAAKWSSISELAAKIVIPITNMILARVLAPEVFGIVATITMLISFCEMLSDAGFQKYIIQHEFKTENEKYESINIAFWTNLSFTLILWAIIIIFSDSIATLTGNPGFGKVITVACFQLPITSLSSLQIANYKRDLNFKTLFITRMVGAFMPLLVTIPLALLNFSYWALIIGMLSSQLVCVIILTIKSKWKPRLFYKFSILKKMASFSIWSLIEACSIWLTMWVDAFIIGSVLNEYYLGLYKTSTSMVNSLMAIVTASVIPVLFSALSRLQDNQSKFNEMFFSTQRFVSMFTLPLGVGIFLFRDLATTILFGSKWSEAGDIVGIWALTSSLVIVFGNFNSEAYRAKGKPKLSFLSQVLHLVVLVPTCIISSRFGFWTLVYSRSLIRIQGIVVGFLIMKYSIGISVMETFKNVLPGLISALLMGVFGYYFIEINSGILWEIFSIFVCGMLYFGLLCLFPQSRKEIGELMKKIKNK